MQTGRNQRGKFLFDQRLWVANMFLTSSSSFSSATSSAPPSFLFFSPACVCFVEMKIANQDCLCCCSDTPKYGVNLFLLTLKKKKSKEQLITLPFCCHCRGFWVKTTQQHLTAIQAHWPLAPITSIPVTPTHPLQCLLSKCGPNGWVFPTGPSVAPGAPGQRNLFKWPFFPLLLLLLRLKN